MTSTIFTRRAMLSGSALLGLGTLLAACGQQANSEAAGRLGIIDHCSERDRFGVCSGI